MGNSDFREPGRTFASRGCGAAQRGPLRSAKMQRMPCCLLLLVLLFPRVVLVLMFLLSTYLQRAYHGLLIPLLGFIFLPLTTVVYAWLVNSGRPTDGVYLVLLIVAVVMDVGGLGGGEYHRRRG